MGFRTVTHRHTCPSLNNISQTLVDSLITRSELKDIGQKGGDIVDCFFTLTGIRPIEWLMATILQLGYIAAKHVRGTGVVVSLCNGVY